MLKRITLVLFTGLLCLSAKAQFTINEDTLYVSAYVGADSSILAADLDAHAKIYHTGAPAEWIKWTRMNVNVPAKWETAICDIISCRSPGVDTGSFQFGAGDSGDLFFHFYPKNVKGQGNMTVRFSRASNPLEYTDVVIMGTAWGLGVQSLSTAVTKVYPNPVTNIAVLDNDKIDNGTCQVFDAMGQLVLFSIFANHMELDMHALAPGVYTVKILGDDAVSFVKITKQ